MSCTCFEKRNIPKYLAGRQLCQHVWLGYAVYLWHQFHNFYPETGLLTTQPYLNMLRQTLGMTQVKIRYISKPYRLKELLSVICWLCPFVLPLNAGQFEVLHFSLPGHTTSNPQLHHCFVYCWCLLITVSCNGLDTLIKTMTEWILACVNAGKGLRFSWNTWRYLKRSSPMGAPRSLSGTPEPWVLKFYSLCFCISKACEIQ